MESNLEDAFEMICSISSSPISWFCSFTRTATEEKLKPPLFNSIITRDRAASFSEGETESSKSKNISSGFKSRAF